LPGKPARPTWQHQRTQFQGKDALASGGPGAAVGGPARFAKLKIAY
jgi:hypothetical protein